MSWTPPQGGAGPFTGSGLGRGQRTGQASEWATISLGLGILAIFFNFLAVPSIMALVYANKARKLIAASGGSEQGAGRALAGMILGTVGLVIVALYLVIAIVAVTRG
jgi:Domain of unknown function (DUF4190)